MVDLDSNPTKLIEIVEIGKQMLMTRGRSPPSASRTTWQKFRHPPGHAHRGVPGDRPAEHHAAGFPQSAILSAVIFNAIIIVALIPWRFAGAFPAVERGGAPAPQPPRLRLGGVLLPFPGIKIIDIAVNLFHLA